MEEPSGLNSLDKPLEDTGLRATAVMPTSLLFSLETLGSELSSGPLRNSSRALEQSRR